MYKLYWWEKRKEICIIHTWYTVQVYICALFQQRKFQSKSYQQFFHFLIPCFSPLLILRHYDKSLDPFTKRSDTRRGNTAATNTLQTTIQIPLISRKLLYLSSGLNKLHYIWHHKWRVFGCSIQWRLERGWGAYNKIHNQSELVYAQHKTFFERENGKSCCERCWRIVSVRGQHKLRFLLSTQFIPCNTTAIVLM